MEEITLITVLTDNEETYEIKNNNKKHRKRGKSNEQSNSDGKINERP